MQQQELPAAALLCSLAAAGSLVSSLVAYALAKAHSIYGKP